jgi:hypothetical protein
MAVKQQQQHPKRVLFPFLVGSLLMVTLVTLLQSRHIVFDPSESVIDQALRTFQRETLQESKSGDGNEPLASMEEEEEGLAQFKKGEEEPSAANMLPIPSGHDTFSACLLVMDDNHRLPEWLAYHYHVLPLRYLIIAVDPRSRTSPKHILNQWRRMGMYIDEWNDLGFLNPQLASNIIPDDAPLQNKRDRHRSRQKNFYRSCLIAMKEANRTFTMLIDTDEFLMYNHAGGDKQTWEAWETKQLNLHLQSNFAAKKRIRPSTVTPSPGQAGSMMSYIRREKQAGHVSLKTPCISVPRLQFGAVDSTFAERSQQVPSGFDPERFDTLRWRKHAYRSDFVKNGLSKCIIDVSQVNMEQTPKFESLHRPIKTICGAPWVDEWKTLLRIHHYLGSWESYRYALSTLTPHKRLTNETDTLLLYVLQFSQRCSSRWGTQSRGMGISRQ